MSRSGELRGENLVNALLTASRALVAVAARSLADIEENVTLAQYRMLVVLGRHGELSLQQLAGELGVNPSTAMRMVDRLTTAEAVNRRDNPDDRRGVLVCLTGTGLSILRRVTARRYREIDRIVTAMLPRRRAEMVAALNAFAEAAGELDAQPDHASILGW
ncbi:MAG: MarR family transcriptional regulator [Pseudonocardiales bacterium]|nr:MAG: MarR family transcriptional regulator [Pseudonocardiales bacterium]